MFEEVESFSVFQLVYLFSFNYLFCFDWPVPVKICSVHFYSAYLSFVHTLREGKYLSGLYTEHTFSFIKKVI